MAGRTAERRQDRLVIAVPFERQPVLEGPLLRLRPLRQEDFTELYAAASDPLIWEQHPDERWREDVFQEFFSGAMKSGGALTAIDRRDDRIVGTSRFDHYDAARSEVEIGWTFLARSHWGGAFNGEMKRLMLRHAFQHVDRVVFVIYSTMKKPGGCKASVLFSYRKGDQCQVRKLE